MNRLWAAAAALLISAGFNGAQAEDYPARTVTVIVPFAAGGPADITGRIVADIFSRHLGQTAGDDFWRPKQARVRARFWEENAIFMLGRAR